MFCVTQRYTLRSFFGREAKICENETSHTIKPPYFFNGFNCIGRY